jgi:hypothetical protein
MAVPIFVWNGTAWESTGPTIPASPIKYQTTAPSSPSTGDIWVDSDGDVTTGSQQFQRFRFVASGGETTISGADANGAVLAYTAGLEQVVLNGAVLVRGQDYTATTGTTITGLSPALVASDVLEVFSFIAFTVANTYTQSQVDGLLDSYVGLRLITPTSADNGTVGATGAVTFSGVSSVSLNGCFTSKYNNYRVIINLETTSSGTTSSLRFRSGTDNSSSNYASMNHFLTTANTTYTQSNQNTTTNFRVGFSDGGTDMAIIDIFNPMKALRTGYQCVFNGKDGANFTSETTRGQMTVTTAYDGFTYFQNGMSGTIRVYGYKD